jgi:ATP-dependent Clp protease adaptor protein ClpS
MAMKEKKIPDDVPFANENISNGTGDDSFLILYNDDYHSFDYVIDTLVEVCGHNNLQAEQCAFITHFKGSCDIKVGSKAQLDPIRKLLVDKGLLATIEI